MIKPGIPFIPMEPVPYPEPFDDTNFGFQVKWDGTRIIAHSHGNVELFNRKKSKRTKTYPEIVDALAEALKNTHAILDGEIIAIKDGKPNFHQLMRRDKASDLRTIKYLASRIPVTYVVFDILFWKEKSLIHLPFSQRDHILKSSLNSSDAVVVTDTFPGRGKALFDVIKEKGWEGIVAKRMDSIYEIGKKSEKWLKIKNRRQITALIGGFLSEGKKVRSLFLGQVLENDFVFIGRAGSGLDEVEKNLLFETLSNIIENNCPFSFPPDVKKGEKPVWVSPIISVEVEFFDYTEEGYLRQPVIRRINLVS